MSCYRPLEAYRSFAGEVWIGYHPGRDADARRIEVACGRCVGCRLDKCRSWAVRITHEAQLFDANWFATLTYDDQHLPGSLSLEYRDFQLFMKRLRRSVGGDREGPAGGRPLRFFCAGEYGGRTGRPHFHAILFNLRTKDEERLFNGRYRSTKLEELWQNGSVVLDVVNAQTAAYVAGYTQKKVYGRRARERYEDVVSLRTGELTSRRPEFCVMSLKPGIGAWWYEKFGGDLFPGDHAVTEGKRSKVPRYYWNKFRLEADELVVEEIEERRFKRAEERKEDSTPERMAVREELAERRVDFFSERGL